MTTFLGGVIWILGFSPPDQLANFCHHSQITEKLQPRADQWEWRIFSARTETRTADGSGLKGWEFDAQQSGFCLNFCLKVWFLFSKIARLQNYPTSQFWPLQLVLGWYCQYYKRSGTEMKIQILVRWEKGRWKWNSAARQLFLPGNPVSGGLEVAAKNIVASFEIWHHFFKGFCCFWTPFIFKGFCHFYCFQTLSIFKGFCWHCWPFLALASLTFCEIVSKVDIWIYLSNLEISFKALFW